MSGLTSVTVLESNATPTASGSATVAVPQGAISAMVVCSVTGTVSGTSPTLNISIQPRDPTASVQVGSALTSANITATSGSAVLVVGPTCPSVANISQPIILSPTVHVSWTLGGTTPSFGGTTISIIWQF